jgi:hypothetical protein
MTYILSSDITSLEHFVEIVSSTILSPDDILIIEDMDEVAKEMVRVVTDEEGNVIRPAILGCFQFNGDNLSIFIGSRIIKGKAVRDGKKLTIIVESDTGGA